MLNPQLARAEVNKMKKSLLQWLDYRKKLAKVARGEVQGKTPGAKERVAESLATYTPEEIALGKKLKEMLEEIDPAGSFTDDPLENTQIVLTNSSTSPQAQDGIMPWLIAGGTIVILFTIKSVADNARDKRRMELCKETGEGCPFAWKQWLLIGGLGLGVYLVWKHTDFKIWLGQAFGTKKRIEV